MKIQLIRTLAADDADVLKTANSGFQRAPADGEIRIWMCSDQADGLVSVTVASRKVVEESNLPVVTVGQLKTDGAPLFGFPVGRGEEIQINYNEVTPGTATVMVQFLDEIELLREQGYSENMIARELG